MSESGAIKVPDSDDTGPISFDISDDRAASISSPVPSRLVLATSFLSAFAIAACLLILIGHFAFHAPRSLSPFDPVEPTAPGEAIASPFVVNASGIYEKVAADAALNPTKGKDYVFFIWFKLRKAPRVGEYLGLAGKFDVTQKHRPGFAITLEGAPDGVRPRVYWNSEARNGVWYSFSSSYFSRKQWYLLAISFSKDTFLSAHLTSAGTAEPISLLGGHRIEPETIPASNADIQVGSYGSSKFRGQIGPFGVLSGEKLSKELPEYLAAMQANPAGIPDEIPNKVVQLWASPHRDLGPHALAVTPGSGPSEEVRPAPEKKVAPKAAVKKTPAKKKTPHIRKRR